MSEIMEVFWRTLLAFILFIGIARLLGKQTMSYLTLNQFIAAATLGSITGNLAFNLNIKTWHAVFAMLTFFVTSILVLVFTVKSRKARRWISGEPTVLIEDGHILEKNMGKAKFTIDNLNQLLREKGVFDIYEVQYAILETNGGISIQKKPPFRSITRQDLNLTFQKDSQFPVELIMEQEILGDNLKENQLTDAWLQQELKNRGLALEDVYYAVQGTNGNLYFDSYADRLKAPIDKE
ncbi:DUF421 domain-containing protein [Fictibacillus enclensis]|uniref:DUF421 domain-containing protein n=1 Tax=Fictibacillus enclensis TaxID=1017270 RepID=UPI0025A2FBF2|nr:DUF421 domain-containing protein [Fictibacillus enclensis]MDM5336061.1 DUF421 domain-containing protein [Fictibacillus enclensis]